MSSGKSRSHARARSKSGKSSPTVDQNRGPWLSSRRCASSCDHVVDDLHREVHQSPVQPDGSIGRAAAPARARRRQGPSARRASQPLGEHRNALGEDFARACLQPGLHAVAQLLLAGTRRQPHPQQVAVSSDAARARVDRQRERGAQEAQRRTVVPADRDPLATRFVVAPFDQLAQDPARLLLQRSLDLAHRHPARSSDPQAAVVDDETDRAPARAAQLVVNRLLAQHRRAHAGGRAHGRRRRRGRQVEQRQGQLERRVGDGLRAGRGFAGRIRAARGGSVWWTFQAIGSFVAPVCASLR